MTAPDLDLPRLLDVASGVLDAAAPAFVGGFGAPSVVHKGANDFATQVDLDLERTIGDQLHTATGIPVHGEEFGGPPVEHGTVWVLDPVDGTFNYSTGVPLCGMLLALLVDGQVVLGLTWLPLVARRYAAVADGPLFCEGSQLIPPEPAGLDRSAIAFGPFDVTAHGRYPGARRADLLEVLSSRAGKLRMTGSTGVDLAYTAAGVFGGAIAFGGHPWDNAAGVALVRAAGGIATDLAGNPWTVSSPSVVAGRSGVHGEIMAIIGEVIGDDWSADPPNPTRQEHTR